LWRRPKLKPGCGARKEGRMVFHLDFLRTKGFCNERKFSEM